MNRIQSIVTAVLAEIAAIYLLFNLTQGTAQVLGFLGAHLGASALIAWGAHFFLPQRFREPRAPALAVLFSFAFFIPIVGLAGLLLAMLVAVLIPRKLRFTPFTEVAAPEYVLSLREPEVSMRLAGLKPVLLDASHPAQGRVKSLVALENMPPRVAGPLLRQLLSDPADDIRLLAYSMLDVQEKAINAHIQEHQEELARAETPEERLRPLRRLAELNWELVYAGLAHGDVARHALAQALAHVEKALEIAPNDPGLWFLKGRICDARGDRDGASQDYSIAVSCGLPEVRALPYVAEIAFQRHDLAAVRELLRMIAEGHFSSTVAPAMRYWLGRCRV